MNKFEIHFSNLKLAQLLQSQLSARFEVAVSLEEGEDGKIFLISETLNPSMIEHIKMFEQQVGKFANRAQVKKIVQPGIVDMRSIKGCSIDGFSMSAVPGVVGEYGEMARLVEEIDQFCLEKFALLNPKSVVLPQIILRSDLVKMGYLPRDEKQVAELVVKPHAEHQYCLSPAVCLGLYPQVATLLKQNVDQEHFTCRGFAHRNEAGKFTANPPSRHPSLRLRHFQVREIIWLGSKFGLDDFRHFFLEFAKLFSQHFSLPLEIWTANDVFFEPVDTKLAILQLINQSKMELIVNVEGFPVSIASFNDHQDHFTGAYASPEGNRHSACIGIGLERAAYAVACVRKE